LAKNVFVPGGIRQINESLDAAKESFKIARDRLESGGKKGDTMIGQLERLSELGARPNKSLPEAYIRSLYTLPGDEAA